MKQKINDVGSVNAENVVWKHSRFYLTMLDKTKLDEKIPTF